MPRSLLGPAPSESRRVASRPAIWVAAFPAPPPPLLSQAESVFDKHSGMKQSYDPSQLLVLLPFHRLQPRLVPAITRPRGLSHAGSDVANSAFARNRN